jgi:endonuclease G
MFGLMICAMAQACSPLRADENDSLICLQKSRFLVYYNINKNAPALVLWSLSSADLGRNKRPSAQTFLIDPECPRPRAKSSDFNRSGYQRGHLCPSADRSANAQLMRATFIMSNVAPMCPTLNMQGFAQAEEYSRIMARSGYRCIMLAGSIFGRDSILFLTDSSVGIPDSFFRACIIPDAPAKSVFWLFPNNSQVTHESPFRVPRFRFMATLRRKVKNILDDLVKVW